MPSASTGASEGLGRSPRPLSIGRVSSDCFSRMGRNDGLTRAPDGTFAIGFNKERALEFNTLGYAPYG